MDGIDYCEECEKEHREEVKKLIEQLKAKEQTLAKIRQILDVYYDDDWKATREIERILNDR